MKNKVSKILISVFIFFIFSGALLYIFMPKNEFSPTEKRYLASFPSVSFSSIKDGSFEEGFEKFLADQTPFRSFFVSVNSYFELLKGNNGSSGVYLGKDGWLIEKPFDRDNKFESNIEKVNRFASESGILSSVVIVPSKGCIYGKYLPKNSLEYYDADYIESISSLAPDVKNIDITEEFSKNSDSVQLFYKTDHHWTSEGAYLAYKLICSSLGMNCAPESDFTAEAYNDFYGTSYSTSCYTLTKPDTITLMRSKKTNGAATVSIEDGIQPEIYGNMFFTDALETADKYVVFLNGNHGFERIKTGNDGGKLLLIKDSFAHCLVPFLAENYSEIIMIDLRYYKKPVSEVITDEGITELMFVYGIETFAESTDIILK